MSDDVIRTFIHAWDDWSESSDGRAGPLWRALDDASLALPIQKYGKREPPVQPCGHPAACVVSGDEGTQWCGWCDTATRLADERDEALAAVEAMRERCAGVADEAVAGLKGWSGRPAAERKSMAIHIAARIRALDVERVGRGSA